MDLVPTSRSSASSSTPQPPARNPKRRAGESSRVRGKKTDRTPRSIEQFLVPTNRSSASNSSILQSSARNLKRRAHEESGNTSKRFKSSQTNMDYSIDDSIHNTSSNLGRSVVDPSAPVFEALKDAGKLKPSRPLSTDPKAVRKREKRARETAEEAEVRKAKARSDQQRQRRINANNEGSTMRVYKPRNRDGQTSIDASDSSTTGNQPSTSKMPDASKKAEEDNDKKIRARGKKTVGERIEGRDKRYRLRMSQFAKEFVKQIEFSKDANEHFAANSLDLNDLLPVEVERFQSGLYCWFGRDTLMRLGSNPTDEEILAGVQYLGFASCPIQARQRFHMTFGCDRIEKSSGQNLNPRLKLISKVRAKEIAITVGFDSGYSTYAGKSTESLILDRLLEEKFEEDFANSSLGKNSLMFDGWSEDEKAALVMKTLRRCYLVAKNGHGFDLRSSEKDQKSTLKANFAKQFTGQESVMSKMEPTFQQQGAELSDDFKRTMIDEGDTSALYYWLDSKLIQEIIAKYGRVEKDNIHLAIRYAGKSKRPLKERMLYHRNAAYSEKSKQEAEQVSLKSRFLTSCAEDQADHILIYDFPFSEEKASLLEAIMIKHLQNKDTKHERLFNFKNESRITGESEVDKETEAKIVNTELARLAHLFNAGKLQKISEFFNKKISAPRKSKL